MKKLLQKTTYLSVLLLGMGVFTDTYARPFDFDIDSATGDESDFAAGYFHTPKENNFVRRQSYQSASLRSALDLRAE